MVDPGPLGKAKGSTETPSSNLNWSNANINELSKLRSFALLLGITAGAQAVTSEPTDPCAPSGGSWSSQTPRPWPPPRQATRRERVQARLPWTRDSLSLAQRRVLLRLSQPRPRKVNGHSGARMRRAQWDSVAARGRSQLPTSQSFLRPLPPSHRSRGRRGLPSPGAQSPGSAARSSELRSRPQEPQGWARRWRAWSLQPYPNPPDLGLRRAASAGGPRAVPASGPSALVLDSLL